MSPTFVILLVVAAAVVVMGGSLWLRSRRVKEEPTYHFNCPHCRRRLRFRHHQLGRPGGCPRCKKTFIFPVTPPKEPKP
jgi:predicted Zn finger-like uncharacterized protein